MTIAAPKTASVTGLTEPVAKGATVRGMRAMDTSCSASQNLRPLHLWMRMETYSLETPVERSMGWVRLWDGDSVINYYAMQLISTPLHTCYLNFQY